MQKLNEEHILDIHERIRKIRLESKLTLVQLGKLLDIPDRTISNYERGERKPTYEYLTLLCNKLNAHPKWLLAGTGEMFFPSEEENRKYKLPEGLLPYDFKFIPVFELHEIPAQGYLTEIETNTDYMVFSKNWLKRYIAGANDQMIIVVARGDSMNPVIRDGDILLTDISVKSVKNEGIYVLGLGSHLVVKRIQLQPENKLLVSSDNTVYSSFIVDIAKHRDVCIIGKVIWYGRHIAGM
jgi:phage repressor protein C with HTH and peptisase S24 domain